MRQLRHGYTNDSRTDGEVVVKRYLGPLAAERRETERAALERLPDGFPAPRVLGTSADILVFAHLAGVHGQELMDAGHAAQVLHSCGRLLARLQQLDVTEVFPDRGDGANPPAVVVHGDFGPNNMLFDPETFEVTGLVDWEWAHSGDPVEDLAWCEWIVRMHHPRYVEALDHLFAGYGSRPPWPVRQAAAVSRCAGLVDLVRAGPDAAASVRTWKERTAITRSWTE
jgi:Ser/Thr protein kinase RdoA (MazF antagonist)